MPFSVGRQGRLDRLDRLDRRERCVRPVWFRWRRCECLQGHAGVTPHGQAMMTGHAVSSSQPPPVLHGLGHLLQADRL
ncbi:MAG: hypothetical protein ACOVPA_17390, partial [Rubrivivax sp.]